MQTENILKEPQGNCSFSIGDKCHVFDVQKWMKTGDIGNNECYWVNATITSFRQTDYEELLIDVIIADGRISNGHYIEGVRHCG